MEWPSVRDQESCERPGCDRGEEGGEASGVQFNFAEFELHLNTQVEILVGSLVNKSQVWGEFWAGDSRRQYLNP